MSEAQECRAEREAEWGIRGLGSQVFSATEIWTGELTHFSSFRERNHHPIFVSGGLPCRINDTVATSF